MNAEDFIPYLRKTDADPAIQQLLASLGVKKAPKVKRGDTEARVGLNERGIELIFHPVEEAKSSLLQLGTVLVYGNTQGGEVTPYDGPLPGGLSFKDSRKEARKKLGEPAASNDALYRDTWDYPTHGLTLDYTEGGKSIVFIDISLPYEPEDE